MRSIAILLVFLGVAVPCSAQSRPPAPSRPAPDFLFSKPQAFLTVRASWLLSRGGSDWYDFVTDQLTLESADFNAPGVGIDVGVPLNERIEIQFAFDFNRSSTPSEYRHYVDNNRLPIEQVTTLRSANFGGNIKFSLADRGREVGQFVWVPRKVVPYVGAGAGAIAFNLRQVGDFVDYQDFSVFPEVFESHGWAPSAQVFGGVDVRVWKRLYVTVDGRYLFANADLGADWIDFDPIDLAGFRLSGGINIAF